MIDARPRPGEIKGCCRPIVREKDEVKNREEKEEGWLGRNQEAKMKAKMTASAHKRSAWYGMGARL